LADASGHTAAFGVTVSAGAAAFLLAAGAQPILRRVVRRTDTAKAPGMVDVHA
jgi:hypothetical protein